MPELWWFVSAVGLVLACMASIGTRALSDYSRHDLEELCRRRKQPERLRAVLQGYRKASIAAELLEVLLLVLVVALNAIRWTQLWNEAHSQGFLSQPQIVAPSVVGLSIAILFATVFVPRAISLLCATPVVFYGWPLWKLLTQLMAPLLLLSHVTEVAISRSAGRSIPKESEEQFEEEIRTLVNEGEREGFIEEEAREMIEGVIKLADVTVSEIMTPRTEMVCLPSDVSWEEMLQTITREGHTRIPVFEETRDNIIGILYIKDLLPYLAQPGTEQRPAWTTLLREPVFVPETKSVHALMQEFQKTHNHLAVVLDEYGGVSGIITLEDILEEIVGEIEDELDQETVQEIIIREDGRAEVRGSARVEEINRRLNLNLPEDEEYDTIAGLMMTHLGRVPHVGESLVIANVRLTVLEGDRRRIRRIFLEPSVDSEPDLNQHEDGAGVEIPS